jgi:hypothetical protein
MAWGLPAEISSMHINEEAVPLNGNWCVRLRRKGRGFGGFPSDLKLGHYIGTWGVEGGRSEVRLLRRLRRGFDGKRADLKVGQYMGMGQGSLDSRAVEAEGR